MPRIRASLLASLCVFVLVATAMAEDDPCTIRDGDKLYDLNPLKSNEDYKFKSPEGHEYVINVCKPVITETWNVKVDKTDEVGGFTRQDHGDFSIGYANTTLTLRDGDPTLTMAKGSPCPTHHHMHAASTIHFICDESISGPGEPRMIALLPPPEASSCYFFIEWKTSLACPSYVSSPAWGALRIIASIFGTLLVLYVFLGTLYNYLVLDLRGIDMVPRYSVFTLRDSLEFVRDCFDRVKDRSWDLLHSQRRGWSGGMPSGYRGVASSREEEAGILSGPPGFLDDDDEEDEPEQGNSHHLANAQPSTGMDPNGVIRL